MAWCTDGRTLALDVPPGAFLVRTAHTEGGGQNPNRLKVARFTYTVNRPYTVAASIQGNS